MATGSPRPLPGHYVREYILSRGGWRDLNYAEDVELFARAGFDYYLPVIIKAQIRKIVPKNLAEYDLRRYARDLISSSRRILRYEIGLIRGNGYTLREYLQEPAFKRRPYLKPAGFSSHQVRVALRSSPHPCSPAPRSGLHRAWGRSGSPQGPHILSALSHTSCMC